MAALAKSVRTARSRSTNAACQDLTFDPGFRLLTKKLD